MAIVADIIRIVDRISSDSPETDVFVQSILPRDKSFRKDIESINASLAMGLDGKAVWVDLYPLFLDKEGESIDDSLSNDELHLLGSGYSLWRDTIDHLVNKAGDAAQLGP